MPADIVPLSRFRARLARPRAAKRVDELLSMSDPEAAVASLTVPDLYFTISSVGLADAVDILALATPEQFQGCLDLEIWDRDRAQIEPVLTWFGVLAEAGFEKLTEVWAGLDPELAALVIARQARVYDRSFEEEPPDESELPCFETPDRSFVIELLSDSDDDIRLMHALIGDLYRGDMAVARHVLMSARSELPSDLEEMSYRWRSGRLADLGYPDFYEALEVFRPLDPGSVEVGEGTAERPPVGGEEAQRGPGELPVPMLEQVMGRVLLARALGEISEAAEAERLEAALILLVNKVLAAARVSPGDEEAVTIGTEHATATLALGLEVVCRGDIGEAKRALRTISLVRLHRVGYTVALGLARAAAQVAARATSAGEPSSQVLAALLRQRPFFPRVLDDPPGADVRPFESLADIAKCAAHLGELATRVTLAGALGVDLIASSEISDPPELDAYGRTAIARVLAGGEASALALSAAELERVIAALGRPLPPVDELAAPLIALARAEAFVIDPPVILAIVNRWLGELADELADLDPADVDPRYVTSVLLAAGRD